MLCFCKLPKFQKCIKIFLWLFYWIVIVLFSSNLNTFVFSHELEHLSSVWAHFCRIVSQKEFRLWKHPFIFDLCCWHSRKKFSHGLYVVRKLFYQIPNFISTMISARPEKSEFLSRKLINWIQCIPETQYSLCLQKHARTVITCFFYFGSFHLLTHSTSWPLLTL